jgi:isoquinoline 1-oxidoreductase beta subunit
MRLDRVLDGDMTPSDLAYMLQHLHFRNGNRATARTMLVVAAAKKWNVDPASCRAQSGEVLHTPTPDGH